MHAYEKISLSSAGYVLAIFLIIIHLWMVSKPASAMTYFKGFSRNYGIGRILMGIGMAWFWLLIIPEKFFFTSPIAMDLQDFNSLKTIMALAVPLVAYLIITECKEFLAVRGLGLCLLMAAAPLLAAAWQEPHAFKFLMPLYAYAMITKGLFMVGMPYMTRDLINWATSSPGRFKMVSIAGLAYGVAILACTILFWGKVHS
ncbi:MAG: hypothetical protein QMC23_06330 [Rubritalea sp.]|jgi:hypothetical protein|tara:strand:+ start:403 stop:1005 length:603 start_codon:yes stop_codon:yes gene_type:complete